MKELSPSELFRLSANQEEFSPDVREIDFNGVSLEFHQRTPATAAQLTLVVGEALRKSPDVEIAIAQYFPQLQGKFSSLSGLLILDLIRLIIQETYPGGSIEQP